MRDLSGFRKELAALINKYSLENGSNTPDFLLADYLINSLEAYETIANETDNWYGRRNHENNMKQGGMI